MNEHKWIFPPVSGGDKFGFKNSDLEHFKKHSPFVSLTREIIQNSLDAKNQATTQPVRVEFEVVSQASKSFPDYQRFMKILDLSIKGDHIEVMHNLYNYLRLSEKEINPKYLLICNIDKYMEDNPNKITLVDRVLKASSNRKIYFKK